MNASPSQPLAGARLGRRRPGGTRAPWRTSPPLVFWLACLVGCLALQGAAITQSPLWAAPIGCVLLVALATDIPLVPFLAVALLARVLTDDLSSTASRHSGSLNLSSLIAGVFILLAGGLILRRRQALWPAALAAAGLCLWTAVAVKADGTSAETVREGVREASIVAVALIACNARAQLPMPTVTRLVQLAGMASAVIALYQLAGHSGQLVGGEVRSNGTFSQPNAAAVFFAVATLASLWRFLECGRHRFDGACLILYGASTVATFSLGGLACLLVMLVTFGLARPGALRLKLGSGAVAALVLVAFLLTPLGSARLASESSTSFASNGGRRAAGSSLEWRFDKWRTLIPEWERHPILGSGLGTTTVTEGTSENHTAGLLPHSEVVRYLVESGVVGFSALALALAFLIGGLMRRRRLPAGGSAATLALALTAGLLVNSLAANTLLYTPAAYAAALIVAVGFTPLQRRTVRP